MIFDSLKTELTPTEMQYLFDVLHAEIDGIGEYGEEHAAVWTSLASKFNLGHLV